MQIKQVVNITALSFLGITVNALTADDLHSLIKKSVENNERYVVSHHNLHSLYIYHHDEQMRNFYKNANYTHIDGMPLIFLGRLFGHPLRRKHRVTYADWIRPLMRESAREGWRVFFWGLSQEWLLKLP